MTSPQCVETWAGDDQWKSSTCTAERWASKLPPCLSNISDRNLVGNVTILIPRRQRVVKAQGNLLRPKKTVLQGLLRSPA